MSENWLQELPEADIPLDISVTMCQEENNDITFKEHESYIFNEGDIGKYNISKY